MKRRLLAIRVCYLFVASRANDKVTFGLDWRAEAEYGGYYQQGYPGSEPASIMAHSTLDSGDAMNTARSTQFCRTTSAVGVYPTGLDVTKAYTLRFADKKVGMDLQH